MLGGTLAAYPGSENVTYESMKDAVNTAAPMLEIPHALMLQNAANDRLAKAVEILHDRTSGLRNGHMERASEDRASRDYGSNIARSIADEATRTDLAAQLIEKILSELEL